MMYFACGKLRGAETGQARDSRPDKPTMTFKCVISPVDKSTLYLLLGHKHITRETSYFVSSRSGL